MSEAVRRGNLAAEVMNNEIVREALANLRAVYVAQIRACDVKDDLGRLRYTKLLDDVDMFERHLNAVIDVGKLAAKESTEAQAKTRWVPRF